MSPIAKGRGTAGALVGAVVLLGCAGADPSAPAADLDRAVLERPDTPGSTLLFRFDPADLGSIETLDSTEGNFRVHFVRTGDNAVPAGDADSSGVPDFVESVASVYEEVLAHYTTMGFRAPLSDEAIADNGGDGKFDVYLVDFGGTGDGHFSRDECDAANPEQCAGFMIQENDFVGYSYAPPLHGIQTVSSHEFFHAVQAAYDTDQGSVLAEGTATWATETLYPELDDFDHQVGGYLANADRSLDTPLPGPTDPFSYGSGIFFRFLEQRYDVTLIRKLWERCENGAGGVADPQWFEQLEPLLQDEQAVTFAEAFLEFATWNLHTGPFADESRSYVDAEQWDALDMRELLAPASVDPLRSYYASARYYRVDPDGRQDLRAALVVRPGDEAELDGLEMVLAAEGDAGYTQVRTVEDPTAGVESVDIGEANYLVVAVVNVLQHGVAREPSLCVGTLAEVQACRTEMLGSGGGGGSGGSAGTGGGGGSAVAPAPDEAVDDDGGCGCRTAAAAGTAGPAWAALGWLGAGLLLRRRRRGPTARRPLHECR